MPSSEMEKFRDTDLTARRLESACAIAFSPATQLLPPTSNNDRTMDHRAAGSSQNPDTTIPHSHSLSANVQDVMSIAATAAVMTAKVAQPKYLSDGEFTRLPITL